MCGNLYRGVDCFFSSCDLFCVSKSKRSASVHSFVQIGRDPPSRDDRHIDGRIHSSTTLSLFSIPVTDADLCFLNAEDENCQVQPHAKLQSTSSTGDNCYMRNFSQLQYAFLSTCADFQGALRITFFFCAHLYNPALRSGLPPHSCV